VRNIAIYLVALSSIVLATACEPALLTPLDEEPGNNTNIVTNNATTGNNTTANNTTTTNNNAVTNPFEGDMAAAVEGETLYTDTGCGSCHGAMGEGTAAFPSLEMTPGMSDQEVYDSIYDGLIGTAMSPFGEGNGGPFTEDDTWKVVTFIRALHPQ
jgi:mono/diheme cytochrome c family protein